jgi:hypothetical protein
MSARQASTGLTASERRGHWLNRPHRPLGVFFEFATETNRAGKAALRLLLSAYPARRHASGPLSKKEPRQTDHGEKRSRRVEDDLDGMKRSLIRHDGIMRALGTNGQPEAKLTATVAKSLETNTSLAHIGEVA